MKTKKPMLIELRLKNNPLQSYWTYSSWEEEIIDGEKFTPVTKFMPNDNHLHECHYVKSSTLEPVIEF